MRLATGRTRSINTNCIHTVCASNARHKLYVYNGENTMATFIEYTDDGVQYVECFANGRCGSAIVTNGITAAKMAAYARAFNA